MPDDVAPASSGGSEAAGTGPLTEAVPPMGGSAVAGVVLAAGHSSRMGRNKLLLSVGGEPLVRRVVRAALAAGLSPVLVVLGFEAERVREALAGLPFEEVLNPDYERGINGSVRRGIGAVPAGRVGALIVLADMPYVTATMMARVVARHHETGAPLVLSKYGGVQAPPTFYARSLFGELSDEDEERVGKRVVARHGDGAARVDWPAGMLADIDEPADYDAVAGRLADAPVGEAD